MFGAKYVSLVIHATKSLGNTYTTYAGITNPSKSRTGGMLD